MGFRYMTLVQGSGEAATGDCVNPYAAGGLFGKYKIMRKSWEMAQTLANGYSSESTRRELSNEYQHDRV